MNIPESFKLDKWYNLVILVSGAVFFLTLLGYTSSLVPVIPTLLTSLGVMIIGLGEFVNHRRVTEVVTYSPFEKYLGTGIKRRPNPLGVCMEVVGFIIFTYGLIKYLC